MAFDYKKEYKALYQPPREPQFVTVPAMTFAAVRGQGDPNDPTGEYKAAIELLYGLLDTIKMSKKGSHRVDGYFDFVVCLRWKGCGNRREPGRKASTGHPCSAYRSS